MIPPDYSKPADYHDKLDAALRKAFRKNNVVAVKDIPAAVHHYDSSVREIFIELLMGRQTKDADAGKGAIESYAAALANRYGRSETRMCKNLSLAFNEAIDNVAKGRAR